MEKRAKQQPRPIFVKRIILAFIIATIIFIAGFLVSYMISYSKYQSVNAAQESIRYSFLNIDLEKQLISSSCDLFDISSLSEELGYMGSIIGVLEERFGKIDSRVIKQKQVYTMLEVQHFLLIKEHSENCNSELPIILFFYSNHEDWIDQAEKMGYILSSVKTKNPEVMVYSFDYDLDMSLINILKKKYDIKQANTVVVNEGPKLTNFNNIDEVEAAIYDKGIPQDNTDQNESQSDVILLN